MRKMSVQPLSINQNANQYHEPYVQVPKAAVSRWILISGKR